MDLSRVITCNLVGRYIPQKHVASIVHSHNTDNKCYQFNKLHDFHDRRQLTIFMFGSLVTELIRNARVNLQNY